ncbi:MAG: hypothetical protein M4579_003174 [Chaenotheca gracillima]|nr:MAG: hypothetical protein M4579_003174 [Chaenotheca gracillima]
MSQDMASLGLSPAEFGDDLLQENSFFDSTFAAPAQFTAVNNNTTTSFGSSNTGTVSPQDLMRDPLASMPPSSTLTNLTSPELSLFDTPDVDSYDTSPMFQNADADFGTEPWFSLFPGTNGDGDESPSMANGAAASFALGSDHAQRPSSGNTASPATRTKHSSVSGVSSRKRDKPLPPISVDDPADTVKMKRARNTLAARKSRQRKVERFDELEKTIDDLKNERDHWKNLALSRN